MSSPLILFPAKTAILPPVYFGSIDYYATMAAYGNVVIDRNWRFDKRKNSHIVALLPIPMDYCN